MNLFNEYKHYIVIVLITIVLGYFLGITVSSVVDYRLKDAIINIPKQKNNIIVKLDDYNLNEAFNGKKCKKGKKKKKDKKSPKKTTNVKKGKKTNKSHRKAKKSTKKTCKNKKVRTETEFFENFTSSPEDPNLVEYSKLYKASSKQQAVPYFKAANEEANAQYYQTIN